ncbi:hypothetical protein EDD16DRAFT_1702333 [Pisolithus croceorrhizus]|nr:hypothetical protein EDD16DRAFT_1702333 [Pisolithus croceorrhizus]
MDSQPEDSYGYPTDTDAGQPMDDAGDELLEGPDGIFDSIRIGGTSPEEERVDSSRGKKRSLASCAKSVRSLQKWRSTIDLRLVEWQQKEEQITAWLKKPMRSRKPANNCPFSLQHSNMKIEGGTQATKRIDLYQQALSAFIQEDLTDEQRQAAHDIAEKWNGPDGPTPEVQAEVWSEVHAEFRGGDVAVLRDEDRFFGQVGRMKKGSFRHAGRSHMSYHNGKIMSSTNSMDFNNDIGGGHMFDDIHTISASWREYLGNAYENPDAAAGEEVQNITANRPRAKTGDPVKLVTNDEGDIWIGDLNGHNRDSILQMVRGYLTAHYHEYMDILTICTAHILRIGRACGKWLAKVPFKKLGKYQADMISSHHLPPNFMFNVDPSHMHISMAMELLNFWKERQVSHPNDVFAFQRWLDQGRNLQVPRDGSMLPLQVARKRNTKSRQSPTSADDSTDTDDYNINTEEEATNNMTSC